MRKTANYRYGSDYYLSSEEYKNKRKEKIRNGEYKTANGYRFSRHSKVLVNGVELEFKSSWEFIYALYLFINGVDFKYESLRLPYTDIDGSDRIYIADFLINDEIHEVKGDFEDFNLLIKTKGKAAVDSGYKFKIIKREDINNCASYLRRSNIDVDEMVEVIMKSYKDNIPHFNFNTLISKLI